MIPCDVHMHTHFSSDSNADPRAMVFRAKKIGLTHICITDHMDLDYPDLSCGDFLFEPAAYWKEMEEIRKEAEADGTFSMSLGVEIGLAPGTERRYERLLAEWPWDFVIGSTHVMGRHDPYYPEFWENRPKAQTLTRYFQTVLSNIRTFHDFDTYAHLDYVIRYAPDGLKSGACEACPELIDEILRTLVSLGKCLELNTAGYRDGCGCPNPDPQILGRFLSLGGANLTIGSDAHSPGLIACDFNEAKKVLDELGVHSLSFFRNRVREDIPL